MYDWTKLGKTEHDERVARNTAAHQLQASANVEVQRGWLARPVARLLGKPKNGVAALSKQLRDYSEDADCCEKSTGEWMQPSLG
jgi:hypothetical protein